MKNKNNTNIFVSIYVSVIILFLKIIRFWSKVTYVVKHELVILNGVVRLIFCKEVCEYVNAKPKTKSRALIICWLITDTNRGMQFKCCH